MSAARRLRLPVLVAATAGAALLAGCTPPYIDKALLPSAKAYYRACDWGADCSAAADALSLDQLYAVHLYGRSFHPWRSAAGHFARRGAAAAPYLKAKLQAARDGGEISSIFEIFRAMREKGSFDVRTDPVLVALIQDAAHRVKDPAFFLRDEADELETGERRPFAASVVGRKWLQGYAKDYDVRFARSHCRGCDFRDWRAGIDQLPIDKAYALYRYGWEHFFSTRNIERQLAARGASAIPYLKTRLAIVDRGLALFNILSLLETMRDTGTYDPRTDPELLRLAGEAAARVRGDFAQANDEAVGRLRSGTRHPLAGLRAR